MTMSTNRSVNLAFALFILPVLAPAHAQSTAIRAVAQPAKLSRVTAGAYQEYNKSAFDAASGLQRILYFHATWCPTCKQANADLLKNLNMLPVNVVVFKTDYDREVALKKQYGIISQHTFVLVDAQGNALSKWAGGATREILAHLKK